MDFLGVGKVVGAFFVVVYSSIYSSGQKVLLFNITDPDYGRESNYFMGFYFSGLGPLARVATLFTCKFCKLLYLFIVAICTAMF